MFLLKVGKITKFYCFISETISSSNPCNDLCNLHYKLSNIQHNLHQHSLVIGFIYRSNKNNDDNNNNDNTDAVVITTP